MKLIRELLGQPAITENISHDPDVLMHLANIIRNGKYTNDGEPLVVARLLSLIDKGAKWFTSYHEMAHSTDVKLVDMAKKLEGKELVALAKKLLEHLTAMEPPKIEYPGGVMGWINLVTSKEAAD